MNMNYLVGGAPPGALGNAHQNIVPYQVFACADGHLILAVGNDGQFAQVLRGRGAARSGRAIRALRRMPSACATATTLVPLIEAVMRTRTQRDWLGGPARRRACPCGPINRIDQVFADPQVVARGLQLDCRIRSAGPVPQVRDAAAPVGDAADRRRGRRRCWVNTRVPVLLTRLGDARIAELAAGGVIRRPRRVRWRSGAGLDGESDDRQVTAAPASLRQPAFWIAYVLPGRGVRSRWRWRLFPTRDSARQPRHHDVARRCDGGRPRRSPQR